MTPLQFYIGFLVFSFALIFNFGAVLTSWLFHDPKDEDLFKRYPKWNE